MRHLITITLLLTLVACAPESKDDDIIKRLDTLTTAVKELKSKPPTYEYKVEQFSRDVYLGFDKKLATLAADGWEFQGTLTNNGLNARFVVFRRVKR